MSNKEDIIKQYLNKKFPIYNSKNKLLIGHLEVKKCSNEFGYRMEIKSFEGKEEEMKIELKNQGYLFEN